MSHSRWNTWEQTTGSSEILTSAAAFHEDMVTSIRPLDGAPAQLLKDPARQENVILGGSFLAQEGDHVYNRFLLVMLDGTTPRHDKDVPTYRETCYYEKGNEYGVLTTPLGPMRAALCWEMVRSGTVRRLAGKTDIVLTAGPAPTEASPDRFCLPEQMPQEWIDSWHRWFARGEDFCQTVTQPYLATGEIEEYVPPYLR
jgi:predicted amidohydrolase